MAEPTDTLRSESQPVLRATRAALVSLWPPSGEVWLLRHELAIGRGEADVVLDHGAVSRRHARVVRESGRWQVEDLGSHNGTFLNGRRLEGREALAPGDLVRAGPCLLLCADDGEAFADWRAEALAGPLVGGPAMRRVREFVARLGPSRLELLLVGETGTGKDVVARALHQASGVKGTFVSVNCAAVPADLFEAAFFGHRRGAFTGASSEGTGYFRAAHEGTLFLDEIGELPTEGQAKLLRAIELGEIQPVGAPGPERVRARTIAATNRDLDEAVRGGSFRRDLYERLGGTALWIPPLRRRREDVALLVEHFLVVHADEGPPGATPTVELMEQACLREWRGNVRELARAVREALVTARAEGRSELRAADLPARGASAADGEADLERVEAALRHAAGNVARAARDLGMRRATVYAVLERHGRKPEDYRG